MADSSEPAFLFLYRKEAVAPVDYLSTFATAPFSFVTTVKLPKLIRRLHNRTANSLGQYSYNRTLSPSSLIS